MHSSACTDFSSSDLRSFIVKAAFFIENYYRKVKGNEDSSPAFTGYGSSECIFTFNVYSFLKGSSSELRFPCPDSVSTRESLTIN